MDSDDDDLPGVDLPGDGSFSLDPAPGAGPPLSEPPVSDGSDPPAEQVGPTDSAVVDPADAAGPEPLDAERDELADLLTSDGWIDLGALPAASGPGEPGRLDRGHVPGLDELDTLAGELWTALMPGRTGIRPEDPASAFAEIAASTEDPSVRRAAEVALTLCGVLRGDG